MNKSIFNKISEDAIKISFTKNKSFDNLNKEIKTFQDKYKSEPISILSEEKQIEIVNIINSGFDFLENNNRPSSYTIGSGDVSVTIKEPPMNYSNALEIVYLIGNTINNNPDFYIGHEYKGDIVIFQDWFANRFVYNNKKEAFSIIAQLKTEKRDKHLLCKTFGTDSIYDKAFIKDYSEKNNLPLIAKTGKYFNNQQIHKNGKILLQQIGVDTKSSRANLETLEDAFLLQDIYNSLN